MPPVVLDASAVLALLLGEPGADRVRARRAGAIISAVNYAEVLARTARLCGSPDEAARRVGQHEFAVIPFDRAAAAAAAALEPAGRPLGLSLADRCCLALAAARRLPVLTADRAWQHLSVDVAVELIR